MLFCIETYLTEPNVNFYLHSKFYSLHTGDFLRIIHTKLLHSYKLFKQLTLMDSKQVALIWRTLHLLLSLPRPHTGDSQPWLQV